MNHKKELRLGSTPERVPPWYQSEGSWISNAFWMVIVAVMVGALYSPGARGEVGGDDMEFILPPLNEVCATEACKPNLPEFTESSNSAEN